MKRSTDAHVWPRLFPNEGSLLRLVIAIEMEISEDWIAGKRI
jgi:hypothetical protein